MGHHAFTAMLEVDGLTARRDEAIVVDGASFRAEPGRLVAVVGPNGAGKTTLLEAVLGLCRATGHVRYDGRLLDTFAARARVFAYMPDEARLPEEACVRTLLRAAQPDAAVYEREARRFAVDRVIDRKAASLSRGEQRRVWLAATVLAGRPVLVLDEPFGAFDPLQLDEVLPAVKAVTGTHGIALVTVHQMSIAERFADRIVMLAAGRVVAEGTLAELRERTETRGSLEDVFRALLRGESRHVAT